MKQFVKEIALHVQLRGEFVVPLELVFVELEPPAGCGAGFRFQGVSEGLPSGVQCRS